jgi:hypothetical protein
VPACRRDAAPRRDAGAQASHSPETARVYDWIELGARGIARGPPDG